MSEEEEEFALRDGDLYAIEIATKIARRFLMRPQITPMQIIGLGNALYALTRLPRTTPGAQCEFGIVYREGTRVFGETRAIDFSISAMAFEISLGGSVYIEGVGSSRTWDPGWRVELGGHGCRECNLYDLEGSIEEYLNLGAEISVSDESQIEYEWKIEYELDEEVCGVTDRMST